MTYVHIENACLQISYCNGGVNRYRTESAVKELIRRFTITRPYYDQYPAIDAWLGMLTKEQFETVCDGEAGERDELMKSAPPFCDQMLDEYFEEC